MWAQNHHFLLLPQTVMLKTQSPCLFIYKIRVLPPGSGGQHQLPLRLPPVLAENQKKRYWVSKEKGEELRHKRERKGLISISHSVAPAAPKVACQAFPSEENLGSTWRLRYLIQTNMSPEHLLNISNCKYSASQITLLNILTITDIIVPWPKKPASSYFN